MAHSHTRTLLAKLGFADPDRKEPLHDKACRYLSAPGQAQRLVELTREPPADERREIHSLTRPAQPRANVEVALSKGNGTYKTTIGFVDVVLRAYAETVDFAAYTVDQRAAERREIVRRYAQEARQPAITLHRQDNEPWSALGLQLEQAAWATPEYVELVREVDERQAARQAELLALPRGSDPWRTTTNKRYVVAVEVKIQPVSHAELVRQINLYREYEDYIEDGHAVEWVAALRFDVPESYAAVLASERIRVVRLGAAFDAWVAKDASTDRAANVEDF